MNIIVNNLGVVSGDDLSKVKFVLFEDGNLFFGKCKWHKDLVSTIPNFDSNLKVLGAGVIPVDIINAGLDDSLWGNWESTGYKIITPNYLQELIQKSLILYSEEIKNLY